MRNRAKLFGIIAIIAVIVCMACEQGSTVPELKGNLSIAPNTDLEVNMELTAVYNGTEKISIYLWNKNGKPIPGAINNTYTVTDVGIYTVSISAEGFKPKTSDPVTVGPSTISGTVSISPTEDVRTGTVLTATYSGTETVTYQWRKGGGVIAGATANTFTPTEPGIYTVTVSWEYLSVTSSKVEVRYPELPGTITITPNSGVYIETELTAAYTPAGSEEVATYQWRRGTGNVGTNSYKYTANTAGSYTVTVSAAGYNPMTSAAVNVQNFPQLSGNLTLSPATGVVIGSDNDTLTATYTGTETVTYQWKRYDVVVGETPTPTFKPVLGGRYNVTVRVEGSNSRRTSEPSRVTTSVLSGVPADVAEMISVSGGTFQLGQALGGGVTQTVAPMVTLSDFKIGKFEVTLELWESVMGQATNGNYTNAIDEGERREKRPVAYLQFGAMLEFCNRLSVIYGLKPTYGVPNEDGTYNTDRAGWGGNEVNALNAIEMIPGSNGFRLPTEAQWEYAAKGGNQSAPGWEGFAYSGSDNLAEVGWYSDGEYGGGGNANGRIHEVGMLKPNFLKIYDMTGNIAEFCWNKDSEPNSGRAALTPYPAGPLTDPIGPTSGNNPSRVCRGGAAYYPEPTYYNVYRYAQRVWDMSFNLFGFRLVLPDSN